MYLWIVIAGGIASFTVAMGIGANDVANAIGPFSVIYTIYSTNEISSKLDVPILNNPKETRVIDITLVNVVMLFNFVCVFTREYVVKTTTKA